MFQNHGLLLESTLTRHMHILETKCWQDKTMTRQDICIYLKLSVDKTYAYWQDKTMTHLASSLTKLFSKDVSKSSTNYDTS